MLVARHVCISTYSAVLCHISSLDHTPSTLCAQRGPRRLERIEACPTCPCSCTCNQRSGHQRSGCGGCGCPKPPLVPPLTCGARGHGKCELTPALQCAKRRHVIEHTRVDAQQERTPVPGVIALPDEEEGCFQQPAAALPSVKELGSSIHHVQFAAAHTKTTRACSQKRPS